MFLIFQLMPIVKIEKLRLTQMGIKGNDYTLMSEYQLPADTKWEILRSRMSFTGKVLGEGEFGKVVEAECDGIITADVKTVVAVKKLKGKKSIIPLQCRLVHILLQGTG